jgi:FG-GAP-like repeat
MIPNRPRHAGWWFLPVAGLAASFLAYVGAAGPATTDVGVDSAAPPVPPDVRAACARCHALPPPDSLPRDAWQKTIYLMKGLALEGVGAPMTGPPLVVDFDLKRVVDYYESAAPASWPSPEPWPSAEGQTRFARRAFRAAAGARPLVANVAPLDLDGNGRPIVVAADMAAGVVLGADLSRSDSRLDVLGRVPHPCHVTAADLDADGRTDLLVADLGMEGPGDDLKGSVVWLRREAGGGFRAITLADRLPRVADVEAADFDQDGDLDLVVAAFGWRWVGGIHLLDNRTTDWTRPSFVRRQLDPRTGPVHVPVADPNRDGRPDFVALIAQQHETVVAFLGDGKGGFRQETLDTAPHPGWGSSGLSLVDFDRDGDLDALVTNGDMLDDARVKPYHGIRWLDNAGSFPWAGREIAGLPGVERALAADLDGDGDLDVAACAFVPQGSLPDPASLVWLEQTQPGRFTRHTLERGGRHVSLDAADYDQDGDVDLVVGNFQGEGDVSLEVWENRSERTKGPGR